MNDTPAPAGVDNQIRDLLELHFIVANISGDHPPPRQFYSIIIIKKLESQFYIKPL